MATTNIRLDTDQVTAIASQLENDNEQLKQLLTESKSTVDSLGSYWTGQAADETRSAYEAFSGKYFQQYYEIIEQYVKFLRSNVISQYEDTERVNVQLADAFK